MSNGTQHFTQEQALAILKQATSAVYHSKDGKLQGDAASVQLTRKALCAILGLSKTLGKEAEKEYAAYVPIFGTQGEEVIFDKRVLQKEAGILPRESNLTQPSSERFQRHFRDMTK